MNLDQLYPPFRQKVEELLKNTAARGAVYKVTSAVRTFAEQDKLYAQGRTSPGKIITKAKGGQSYHNYGVAVDFARIVNGKADWTPSAYKILGEEAKKLGLEWGGLWRFLDLPHVQLPVKLSDLQKHYNQHKSLQDVWSWLDTLKG